MERTDDIRSIFFSYILRKAHNIIPFIDWQFERLENFTYTLQICLLGKLLSSDYAGLENVWRNRQC